MQLEIPPLPSQTGLPSADAENLFDGYLPRLIAWGQAATNSPSPAYAHDLAQELACITQQQVLFLVARQLPSHPITVQAPAGRIIIPVEWGGMRYGYLAVVPPSPATLPSLSRLASFCGWLLRMLEDAAFVQRQRCHLPYEALHRVFTLSKRCRHVLALMIRGASTDEIAHRLHISKRTVERHQLNCYRHLQVQSAAEAIVVGIAADLASQEADLSLISHHS